MERAESGLKRADDGRSRPPSGGVGPNPRRSGARIFPFHPETPAHQGTSQHPPVPARWARWLKTGRSGQTRRSPCGGARLGWLECAGSTGSAVWRRCSRIRSMTASCSMLAITRCLTALGGSDGVRPGHNLCPVRARRCEHAMVPADPILTRVPSSCIVGFTELPAADKPVISGTNPAWPVAGRHQFRGPPKNTSRYCRIASPFHRRPHRDTASLRRGLPPVSQDRCRQR